MRKWSVVALLALAVGLGCGQKDEAKPAARKVPAPPAAQEPVGPTVAAGDARGELGTTQFAIYFLPRAKGDAMARAKKLIEATGLAVVESVDKDTPLPVAVLAQPKLAEYSPPTPETLAYFGRGLSDDQVAAVQTSKQVLTVSVFAPGAKANAWHGKALTLMASLVAQTGGLVWDENTRELFSPAMWQKRVDANMTPVPLVQSVTTIHPYTPEGGTMARLVSLGMDKLALPDLVIEDIPMAYAPRAAVLLLAVAQLLAEGQKVGAGGAFEVALAKLANPRAKEILSEDTHDTGAIRVTLHPAKRLEGDPENRLWEIRVGGTGARLERLAAALDTLLGTNEGVIGAARDDAELLAASKRANKELLALEARFKGGLEDATQLLVKAPFETSDGSHEFMWLEVHDWKDGTLSGVLINEPLDVPELHKGATVEVEAASAFDYRLIGPHVDRGGETELLLRRREAATAKPTP